MDKQHTLITNKILLVFDLDYTILNGNSSTFIIKKLLNEESKKQLREKTKDKNNNWANLMQEVLSFMKNANIDLNQIKEVVESIPLNEGFLELFQFIRNNNQFFKVIIISGGNDLFIKWIIDKYDLSDLVVDYHTNKVEIEDNSLKITQNHIHECQMCNKCQCKGVILEDYLNSGKYSHIVYVGDGENDYCAGKVLREEDILFPRENFGLHKYIIKENKNLKCKVILWADGHKINEELNKLINYYNSAPKF